MGRRRFAVALIAGSAAGLAQLSFAQNPGANAAAAPHIRPNPAMRERWRAMSPDDRQRFRQNAERWLAMPPEQRRALRIQEDLRRERLRHEAETALHNSGMQLEGERREQFEQRYVEERRKVDRALRQELQERRQREMAPVVEQLKKEFTPPAQSSAAPTAVHTSSVSPSK